MNALRTEIYRKYSHLLHIQKLGTLRLPRRSIARLGLLGRGEQERRIHRLETNPIHLLDSPRDRDVPELDFARQGFKGLVSDGEAVDGRDVDRKATGTSLILSAIWEN